jgi:hypothetical protein
MIGRNFHACGEPARGRKLAMMFGRPVMTDPGPHERESASIVNNQSEIDPDSIIPIYCCNETSRKKAATAASKNTASARSRFRGHSWGGSLRRESRTQAYFFFCRASCSWQINEIWFKRGSAKPCAKDTVADLGKDDSLAMFGGKQTKKRTKLALQIARLGNTKVIR